MSVCLFLSRGWRRDRRHSKSIPSLSRIVVSTPHVLPLILGFYTCFVGLLYFALTSPTIKAAAIFLSQNNDMRAPYTIMEERTSTLNIFHIDGPSMEEYGCDDSFIAWCVYGKIVFFFFVMSDVTVFFIPDLSRRWWETLNILKVFYWN